MENSSQKSQDSIKPIRLIIAGGGTGGHIFPAIAIADAIKVIQPDAQILFIGSKGKMEMEKVPEAGYQIEGLEIAGFNRTSVLKNISLPYKLIKSFWQVKKIFSSFHPDAAIGVGGYSSFPVLRYAQLMGIKTFIHESNSFAGKSNKLIGKRADHVFVAFDNMEMFFPTSKIMVTGNPVRKDIAESTYSKVEACKYFGLNPAKKCLLIIGGSLGAKSINDEILFRLKEFRDQGIELLWQTGKNNAAYYLQNAADFKNVKVQEFIKEMAKAYAVADVVISRSGAMAVTELVITGKPAVFVPYPFASEDHQTSNALNLVKKEAACLVKDKEVPKKLYEVVIQLLDDPYKQDVFKSNLRPLALKNAAEVIAETILKNMN